MAKPTQKKPTTKKQPYCHRCKKHLAEKSVPKHIKMHSDKGEGHSITYPGKKGKKVYRPKTTPTSPRKKSTRRASLIGNQFWRIRSSHGRNPKFEKPHHLRDACIEYFKYVDENPLKEYVVKTVKGELKTVEVPKMRAMTIDGLTIFLDITDETWREYRKKDGFSGVTSTVDKIIKDQKFAGAAADLLNANIIARDLGLSDKKEVAGPGGGPIQTINREMSAEEAADVYNDILN